MPTPADEWATLKKLLGDAKRPDAIPARDFAVAYVPYRDGRIVYHEGNEAVLSAEYSGCLMGVYERRAQRSRVDVPSRTRSATTASASSGTGSPPTRRRRATTRRAGQGGPRVTHYFQPFVVSRDADLQAVLIGKLMQERFINDPYGFTVFGLVTATDNDCVSIWAVKTRAPSPPPASCGTCCR